MASLEKIVAERDVDRMERDAESQWRTDGRSTPLTNVTNEVLREKLIETLADVEPMRKLVTKINEAATDTLDGMMSSDLVSRLRNNAEDAGVDGEEIIKAHDVVKMSKPGDLASNMLDLLEASVRFYSSRVERHRQEELPAILHVPLPPRTKRLRTGATTAWLPFLYSHAEGANVAVNDPLPSPLGPVVSGKEKKKRTKAEKKAA